MTLRLVLDDVVVDYPSKHIPVVGQLIVTDGSDSDLPGGVYQVEDVMFLLALQQEILQCRLTRVTDRYPADAPISLVNNHIFVKPTVSAQARQTLPVEQVIALLDDGSNISHVDSDSLEAASSYASYHKLSQTIQDTIDREYFVAREQELRDQPRLSVSEQLEHASKTIDRLISQTNNYCLQEVLDAAQQAKANLQRMKDEL